MVYFIFHIFWVTPACVWCCDDASTFTEHEENHQTSNLNNMKYSGQHSKRRCPDHKADIRSQQLCVCVFFPFILDVKFVGSTSRGHSGFLIHLPSAVRTFIFLARRIQPFLSLVDPEARLRKNPSHRDSNYVTTCQKVTRLPTELPGGKRKEKEKRTIEKKKRKEKKHLTVVDPETLFMRNSPRHALRNTCIA